LHHSDIITTTTTTTTTAMSSDQQQQQQQQQQQRRSRKRRQLLVFEQQHQLQDKNNRLRIINKNDDVNNNVNDVNDVNDTATSATTSTAICDLAGLVPFVTSTSFPLLYGYEIALAIELAIQHLNTAPKNNDSIIIPELLASANFNKDYCPIQFSSIYLDTKRNPSTSFAEVDVLTRTTVTTEYDYLMNVSSSTFDLRPDTTTERQPSSSSNTRVGSSLSRNNVLPCAIVGAHDSKSSKTTALVSGMRGFPQISPGTYCSKVNVNEMK
jgi:hypothetical protein